MRIKTYHSVFRRHASQPVNTQSSIVLSSLRQRKQARTLYWWQNCGNRAKSLKLKCFDFALSVRIIRKLMQQRRRWLRKRHLKSAVALLNIYRDCSISFSSSNADNFFLDLNSKRLYLSSGKEKESLCLEFTSSTKRGILRRSREVTAKQCTKKRDARANLFFLGGGGERGGNLNLLLFWSSRWRRRHRCLRSLSTLTVLPKHENNRFSILSIYVFSKRVWD